MRSAEKRQSRASRWISAWFLTLAAAAASAQEKPLPFDGKPVNAVLSSGRDYTWVPKPPPVMMGVIKVGTVREVFMGFVDASMETDRNEIGASATSKRFTMAVAPEAEGKKFKGKVTYQVQEEVYAGFRKWRKSGPLQTKEAEIVVHIAQSVPSKIIVAAKLSNDLKMAGDARAVDITPSRTPIADTNLSDPRRPIVIGKRPGKAEFKLKYRIDGQDLLLPVVVEVVDKETTIPIVLEEGAEEWIKASRLEIGTILKNWKLVEVLGVKRPAIASARKAKDDLLVTGRDQGSTRVTAIYSAVDPGAKDARPLKIKVKFEVKVVPPGNRAAVP